MKSRQKALLVRKLAKEKKARGLVILDMRKVSNITDFFIICTADSKRRAQTITDNIEKYLQDIRQPVGSIQGYQEGGWILVDAYDVVVHIFNSELRKFYNLEGLWGNAPRVRLCRKKRKRLSEKTLGRK